MSLNVRLWQNYLDPYFVFCGKLLANKFAIIIAWNPSSHRLNQHQVNRKNPSSTKECR
ncbi:hypothetical protein QWZ16_14650 [Vibrio ostreicida]|uniref:Uncharacterized protein n=1 Tax=Vibrio ostreicida TaxID=526588 RepID=A0ABT8BUW5_9VIBR|nr:hypothetical protein [Vibrio ostreicida]MDN3610935.1 hypothetical protein [Vibrio ostreicida]